jgi:hypothetical protein
VYNNGSFEEKKRRTLRKSNPEQAWTGPEDSRRLRLPFFKTFGT